VVISSTGKHLGDVCMRVKQEVNIIENWIRRSEHISEQINFMKSYIKRISGKLMPENRLKIT